MVAVVAVVAVVVQKVLLGPGERVISSTQLCR